MLSLGGEPRARLRVQYDPELSGLGVWNAHGVASPGVWIGFFRLCKDVMKQGANGRRTRGRSGGRKQVPLKMQNFDSNGPDVRVRGHATQVYEKYLSLARDASSAGDRVIAESYFQHAEHYYRIMNENTDPGLDRGTADRTNRDDDVDDDVDDDAQSGSDGRGARGTRQERRARHERQERGGQPDGAADAQGDGAVSENSDGDGGGREKGADGGEGKTPRKRGPARSRRGGQNGGGRGRKGASSSPDSGVGDGPSGNGKGGGTSEAGTSGNGGAERDGADGRTDNAANG